MTTNPSSLAAMCNPRVCELGKIKIGGRSAQVRRSAAGNEWRAPEKWDHFVITTLARNDHDDFTPDVDLMALLIDKHGDADGKLRQIPISVLSDDLDEIMQSRWVWYGGRKLAGISDGITCTFKHDPTNGKMLPEPRVEPWRPEFADYKDTRGNRLFHKHSTFNCVILAGESRWGGVYKFRTGSSISSDQLYGSLLHIAELTGGTLRGLPMMMVVRPIIVSPEGKATKVYVVHVELRGPDLQAIQAKAIEAQRFQVENRGRLESLKRQYKALLVAPGELESEREQARANEEWQPDTIDVTPPEQTDPLLAALGVAVEKEQAQPEATKTEPAKVDNGEFTPEQLDELFKESRRTDAGNGGGDATTAQ